MDGVVPPKNLGIANKYLVMKRFKLHKNVHPALLPHSMGSLNKMPVNSQSKFSSIWKQLVFFFSILNKSDLVYSILKMNAVFIILNRNIYNLYKHYLICCGQNIKPSG